MSEIARALLRNELRAAEISELAHEHWSHGRFVHYVDPRDLPPVSPTGPTASRYGGAETVEHRRLYGVAGSAGCIVVHCPHDERYRGDFTDLLVPPHAHPTDHIAIVLQGRGEFVTARAEAFDGNAIYADARPGMIAFYPGGVPHTFIVGPDGIVVASVTVGVR